jgi:SNW domain-containing protein 1
MERPSEDEVNATAARTQAALEKLTQSKIKAAQPKAIQIAKANENYVRYTPGSSTGQQRIIKMVDVVEDPLEPPRFKGKKVPRGPPSPPAPIMRSPPRKVTAQEQKDWMIPPCVSNWKNNKGYTIPLDKRLAADGRGLQDVSALVVVCSYCLRHGLTDATTVPDQRPFRHSLRIPIHCRPSRA